MTASSSNDGSRCTDGSRSINGVDLPRGSTRPENRPDTMPTQAVITSSQHPSPPTLALPPAALELPPAPLEDELTPAVLELQPTTHSGILNQEIWFPQPQPPTQPSGDPIRRPMTTQTSSQQPSPPVLHLPPSALELLPAALPEMLSPEITIPQPISSGQVYGDPIRRSPNPQLPTPPPTPEPLPPTSEPLPPTSPPAPPSTPVLGADVPHVQHNPFLLNPECGCRTCNGERSP
jgi:hypothetical protein